MDGEWDRLPESARAWLEAVRRHPVVQGVLLAGGCGRGDLWPGSDVDLWVVSDQERCPDLGRPEVGERFADVHHVSIAALGRLIAEPDAFAASPLVDETAGGVPLHDPDGLLRRWLDAVSGRLADPGVWAARARARLTAARDALDGAQADPDPLERALLARDAARLGAWAYTAGRGGLVTSARRFADRFLANCVPDIGRAFVQAWNLGGGRAEVDAAITSLRLALASALEMASRHPHREDEPSWVKGWRDSAPPERAAFLARHPLPLLLAPTMARGYYSGALMWMRGYYRLGFKGLLAALPPDERPVAALWRFHGLTGDEQASCRRLLDLVGATLP